MCDNMLSIKVVLWGTAPWIELGHKQWHLEWGLHHIHETHMLFYRYILNITEQTACTDRIRVDRIRKFLKIQTVRRYRCKKTGEEKIVPHLTRWLGVMILLQNMSIQSSLLCWRLCCSRYNQTIQPSKSNEICWECDMFWKNRRVCRCSLWWACVSKRLPFSPIYI